jgi:hypothetical protein
MRGIVTLVVVGFGAMSFGDRIVDVPIGRSLQMGTFQISDMEGMNQGSVHDRYVAYSPLHGFEFGIRQRTRPSETDKVTADFAYNIVAPVAALSPGISVGMLDALNATVDGRRTYVAVTFRELLDVGQKGSNGEATMGIQFGHINSGFVGVNLPLSNNFRFLVEHNGARISTGFELALDKKVKARIITQEGTLLMGLNLSRRF